MDESIIGQAFLTVTELAELLRVSRRTAYVLVRTGEVPSVRVGGSIRIPRAALVDQLVQALEEQDTGTAWSVAQDRELGLRPYLAEKGKKE
jgi:excisionase family DNA binding protein